MAATKAIQCFIYKKNKPIINIINFCFMVIFDSSSYSVDCGPEVNGTEVWLSVIVPPELDLDFGHPELIDRDRP